MSSIYLEEKTFFLSLDIRRREEEKCQIRKR